MEPYIVPPPSEINPFAVDKAKEEVVEPPSQGKMQIYLQLKSLTACVSDKHKNKFFMIEGQIIVRLLIQPSVPE